ncbi:MAG: hypothetical protein Q9N67_11490 [Ghiorsea sp.]|nr:hypothetical protein [Ghiorsea sp.]
MIAWLDYDFESREKKLKAGLAYEKQRSIADIEKIHASQIENLFRNKNESSKHLENAYADIEKYKRMLANQENENALLIQKMKGKDAVIMRLKRKIDRLETPRF